MTLASSFPDLSDIPRSSLQVPDILMIVGKGCGTVTLSWDFPEFAGAFPTSSVASPG
jgi:hypothetical protein